MKVFSVKKPVITQPVSLARLPGFRQKPIVLQDSVSRWRKTLSLLDLDVGVRHKAETKLGWIIFYYAMANKDAYQTARYFNVTAKTIYKWVNRFESSGQNVNSLVEQSRRPNNVRQWTVTLLEEARIKKLRHEHFVWGRKKIQKLYKDTYHEDISAWKIDCVIQRYKLYPNPAKQEQVASKRARNASKPKLKITRFTYSNRLWDLIHVDGIVIYRNGLKRYIFTAVDHTGKVGYAGMYNTKAGQNAKDFLYRLHYLVDGQTPDVQTDNGSEFYGAFDQALTELEILHWYSRPHTPTDNAEVERFNQTLQYEWLNWGHFTPDCEKFNKSLTNWLEEYNNVRPHQSLNYMTPLEFMEQSLLQSHRPTTTKLLPMYPASTPTLHLLLFLLQ